MKKTLSHFPDTPWTNLLPILVKQLNCTPYPSTGFSPLSLLHGQNSLSADSPFQEPTSSKVYPLLQNFKTQINDKMIETDQITSFIRKEIQIRSAELQQKINKTRSSTPYNVGDYIFVKNRSIIPGVNPSLRPTYCDDPHIVINDRPTTLVTQRLCDTFKSVYAKDDVKKYNRLDASFSHLPSEVCNVLINKFADLDKLDFTIIQKHAEIPISQGLDLHPDIFHLPPHDTLDSQHNTLPALSFPTNQSNATTFDNKATTPTDATTFNIKPKNLTNATAFNVYAENLADDTTFDAEPTNLTDATTFVENVNISPNHQPLQTLSQDKNDITSSPYIPTSLPSKVSKSPVPQPDYMISHTHQYRTRARAVSNPTSDSSDSSDNEDLPLKKQVSFQF